MPFSKPSCGCSRLPSQLLASTPRPAPGALPAPVPPLPLARCPPSAGSAPPPFSFSARSTGLGVQVRLDRVAADRRLDPVDGREPLVLQRAEDRVLDEVRAALADRVDAACCSPRRSGCSAAAGCAGPRPAPAPGPPLSVHGRAVHVSAPAPVPAPRSGRPGRGGRRWSAAWPRRRRSGSASRSTGPRRSGSASAALRPIAVSIRLIVANRLSSAGRGSRSG